jgi:hypothetical protein
MMPTGNARERLETYATSTEENAVIQHEQRRRTEGNLCYHILNELEKEDGRVSRGSLTDAASFMGNSSSLTTVLPL